MGETRHVHNGSQIRIAYDDAGEGEPVVLVHGLGGSRRRWKPFAEDLRGRGYRVITFDLRGFGESAPSPGPYSVESLASDLAAVVHACDLSSFHLLGHSLGGMVAQTFALEHGDRVRTLALVSTTSHNGRRASAFGRAMAVVSERGFDAALRDDAVREQLEELLAEAFPRSEPPLDLFRKGLERPHPHQARAWQATVGFSTKDRLPQLAMPVLVVHGTADQVIPVIMGQLIHRAIAGSTLRLLEGAGHHPHRDQPEAFGESFRAFLEQG